MDERQQRIDAIRERLSKVPGPWKRSTGSVWDEDVARIVVSNGPEVPGDLLDDGEDVVVVQAPITPYAYPSGAFLDVHAFDAAMEFIAHSWDDVAWLLEQVSRATPREEE